MRLQGRTFLRAGLGVSFDTQLPRGAQGAFKYVFVRFRQPDMRRSHAAPSTVNGKKNIWEFSDESGLLLGREHQVSVALCLRSKRRKDPAAHAEIRMAHM